MKSSVASLPTTRILLPTLRRRLLIASLLSACCLAPLTLQGQGVAVSDNFNDGNDLGWTPYDGAHNAANPNNAPSMRRFPSDGVGGFYYRLSQSPPTDDSLGPARLASFRAEAVYADFSVAADIITWDDATPDNFGGVLARVPNVGAGALNGYLVAYFEAGPGVPVATFGNLKFVAEGAVFADFLETFHGGVSMVSRLSNARRYRLVFTGSGPALRGALYDRSDLLEPIVRIAFQDNGEGGTAAFPSGASGLVAVNANDDLPTDWTFDNYYSTEDPANFVGFPGTPQVVDLVPAPQTLFYNAPATDPISFKLRTFTTNQINTNSVRMLLNGADVTSQLRITADGGLLDPPRTHYAVRWAGSLASDKLYSGRIIVNDTGGKGTTNTWTFDTFQSFDELDFSYSEGRVTIEAEDYNYGSGQFQDAPVVSGLTPDGMTVGGTVFLDGYYNATGTPNVDFSEPTRTGIARPTAQQYRNDPVGTLQDKRLAGDTARPKHVSANVPDYVIWQVDTGEWWNYTRIFPDANYHVYLRASSQARQDVRLDQVTGDPTMPAQAKAIRGVFLVPNTGSSTRYRYVQLTDAVGNPQAMHLSGAQTLRMTAPEARTQGSAFDALGDLQLNYMMLIPATGTPGPLLPWVANASPSRDAVADPDSAVQIMILNRDTDVDLASIQLRFDGTDVTGQTTVSGTTTEGPGATITYQPPASLRPNSIHTIHLIFADNAATPNRQTNQWGFSIKDMLILPTAWAHSGLNVERGLKVQVHKAPNSSPGADFPNSAERAERQLNNQIIDPNTMQPYPNEAAGPNGMGIYGASSGINYEQGGASAGLIGGDQPYPGIPAQDADYIAMAATAYLQLTPGAYRFGGFSDDGFLVTAGPDLPGTNVLVGSLPGCCTSVEFDFFVDTAGLYAFRFLHWEGIGGAFVEFYSVNKRTGARTLINDLAATDSVRAFRIPGQDLNENRLINPRLDGNTFRVSFTTATGRTYTLEYTDDLATVNWQTLPSVNGDGTVQTISDPEFRNTRFYRLLVQ